MSKNLDIFHNVFVYAKWGLQTKEHFWSEETFFLFTAIFFVICKNIRVYPCSKLFARRSMLHFESHLISHSTIEV